MFVFVLYIFVLFLLIYWALIFESASMAMLAFGFALFVVLSFLFLIYLKFKITLSFEQSSMIINEFEDLRVPIRITNNSFLKLDTIRICSVSRNILTGKKYKLKSIMENVPTKTSNSVIKYMYPVAGKYELKLKKVSVYDKTGILRINLKFNGHMDVIVLPELFNMQIETGMGVNNFFSDTDFYDELRPGNTINENFDVREYIPGDKLQLIHWRLSAKYDETYIRERAENKPCAITLFYDPKKDEVVHKLTLVNYISSLSLSLMSNKVPHFVAWYSKSIGDVIRARVFDEESFYVFIVSMIQDLNYKNPGSILDEYAFKYKGDPYLHYVLFNNSENCEFDEKKVKLTEISNMYFYFE